MSLNLSITQTLNNIQVIKKSLVKVAKEDLVQSKHRMEFPTMHLKLKTIWIDSVY